jgi:predicted HTH domain antitoxin
MPADPISLSQAKNPSKEALLALVDELRGEIERNECLALIVVPLFNEHRFHVRSAGSISMAKMAGLLGRAWMDATQALEDS